MWLMETNQVSCSLPFPRVEMRPRRAAGSAPLEALEAGLISVEAIPEGERQEHLTYYDQTLGGIRALNSLPLAALPERQGAGKVSAEMSDWAHPRWPDKRSCDFGYHLERNFSKWDANSDGKLTLSELKQAEARTDLRTAELAALKIAIEEFATLARLSEDGPGEPAITRKGLAALATRARQESPWVSMTNDRYQGLLASADAERNQREMANGRPFTYVNERGKSASVTIVSLGKQDGREEFEVKVGGHTFRVNAPIGLPVLGRLLQLFLDLPESDKARIKRVEFYAGDCPRDPKVAADNNGQGRIRFYRGNQNLVPSVFFHEVGHEVGLAEKKARQTLLGRLVEKYFGSDHWVPPGWESASQKDGTFLTEYSKKSPSEDFAECWAAALIARNSGDPAKLAELKRKIPNRMVILERLLAEKRG